MSTAPPTVSVVIATYNRSQVLRHAIDSVRRSSFTDWELLVVGDGCADGTGECVASFGDPRIQFVNLLQHQGDQSGPNNHGIALSRGRYVAFLNHDDLYLPDHLAACVAELDRGGADLVWTAAVAASPRGDSVAGARPCRFSLQGVPARSGYSPFPFYVASSWMFRRELAGVVGPWPAASGVHVTPSQAWLFRAWQSGAALRFVPRVGVIMVPAGIRPNSYRQRESPDHEWLVRWIAEDPRSLEVMLEEAALVEAMEHVTDVHHASWAALRRLLLRPVHRALQRLRVHPRSLMAVVNYGRRGGIIRHHQQITGAGHAARDPQ